MKYKSVAELSNAVGWYGNLISLPTLKEVEDAISSKNEFQILKWWRFCVHPASDEEKRIQRMISEAWGVIILEYRKELEESKT